MIYGFSNFGFEGSLVNVEADIRDNASAMDIVGLADSCIAGTKEKIKMAIKNSGFTFPEKRVLISLSPADLKKTGDEFDLPIALAILENLKGDNRGRKVLVMGLIDLNGDIHPVRGTFAACQTALEHGINKAILPENCPVPQGVDVIYVKNLKEAEQALQQTDDIQFNDFSDSLNNIHESDDIQINNLKFAMTVAIAGKHNLLAIGGIGGKAKSCLARLPEIMPKLTHEENQTVARIRSIAGLDSPKSNINRPFRMPHQSCSIEGMVGGGMNCRPGEISLAHNGVLFLDEASEFRTSVLQMLRVPMNNNYITLSRAGRSTVYPADFQLVMRVNPCPCGNYRYKKRICLCSQKTIEQYWKKFSAPLLDRVEIRWYETSDDILPYVPMTVNEMRERISRAWRMQKERGEFNGKIGFNSNYVLTDEVLNWFACEEDFRTLQKMTNLKKAFQIIMLARTLADMYGNDLISHDFIDLAMKLRADTPLDEISNE